MSNFKKDSRALRQQKFSNAVIRGRRHVPTPDPIPPSTLLDAPPLPHVPLPSPPPRERLRELNNGRPQNLVTNLNSRQPAPRGGLTTVNRYAKTTTHPDENTKAVDQYGKRMLELKRQQNCMGEDRTQPKKASRGAQTPAPVAMLTEGQWPDLQQNSMGEDRMHLKNDSRRAQTPAPFSMFNENTEVQNVKGCGKPKRRKVPKPAPSPIPETAEVPYNDRMADMKGEVRTPEPTLSPTPDMEENWSKTIRRAGIERMMGRDDDTTQGTTRTKKKRKDKLSSSPKLPPIVDMSEVDKDEENNSRAQVRDKLPKISRKARKQDRTVLRSLTADPGLMLQGSKLSTPGVSLPSIGDGKGLVSGSAALRDIPDDEDMEPQLPPLEFGTKGVGKTASATVAYKRTSDKAKVRSTKRRRQKTDHPSLKDKKARRRSHETPDLSSPDF